MGAEGPGKNGFSRRGVCDGMEVSEGLALWSGELSGAGGLNLRRFAGVTGAELVVDVVAGALAEACVPLPTFRAIDSSLIRKIPSAFRSRQLP